MSETLMKNTEIASKVTNKLMDADQEKTQLLTTLQQELKNTYDTNLNTRIALARTQMTLEYHKYLQKIEGKNPPNISLKTIEKLINEQK